MTKSKEYEKLLKRRENAVRAMKHYEAEVHALDVDDPNSEDYASTALPIIEANYLKFENATNDLEMHDDYSDDDFDPKGEVVIGIYQLLVTKLKRIMKKHKNGSNANSTLNSSNAPSIQDIKLPRIELPKFSGKLEEWPAFYDMFPHMSMKRKYPMLAKCSI